MFTGQFTALHEKDLVHIDRQSGSLRQSPDSYLFCISNYRYSYCSFRYFDDVAKTTTSSINEHLLKHTERIRGQVNERLNIIFVDPQYISKPVPHDNKLVDRELDTFPIALRQGITTLYLRKA